ncbi:MAG: LACX protein [Bacteroidia bacterium]|nr:MAG: LACX protein [Bacteroidia bacterium]
MEYNLQNKHLSLIVSTNGAEIISLKYQNRELIWQAENEWQRHAPILFPIVGKLKNNQYQYNNQFYSLPQHGFARDKEWLCTLHTEDTLQFELTDDEETFNIYPFHFSLIVEYQLVESGVNITFKIFNPYHEILPFSIGYHPGFNTFGELEDCSVIFERNNKSLILQRTFLYNGLISNQKEAISFDNTEIEKLRLNTRLFDNDALVFENSGIVSITLENSSWPYSIKISSPNCKNWGIWTKPNCNKFICIEPWMGIADTVDSNRDILNKKDIILLNAYSGWEWEINLDISTV